MNSYTVIGGGLAGLTAANALADHANKVTLLEQSACLGGRARTQLENGYSVNLGPHALYRGGQAARTFGEWNIPFSGSAPPTASRAYFVRGDRFYPMVTNLRTLLATALFTFREKMEVAKLLRLLAAAQAKPSESMAAHVRQFAATITQISTFAIDLEHLNAQMALRQIASALKYSVLYLDGGWQTLVDGLVKRAQSLGVDIRCGESAQSLDSIDAAGIVLAVGPDAIETLTGIPVPAGHPVRMASLDLGLEGMPEDSPNVAFAVDRPIYFATHSASARLAPQGGRMVHVAKYLGRSAQDPKAVRAELEEFATLAMPRWRQHTKFVRFLPELTVTSMMPTATPRPKGNFLGIDRVAAAGDWVGSEGMLADAAVTSALAAARLVQQRTAAAAA
jgi:phytoene dehydrogenase-like protein